MRTIMAPTYGGSAQSKQLLYIGSHEDGIYKRIPPGLNSTCWAIVHDSEGNLYAGGAFTTAGGVAANRIVKWDGTTYSVLGSGFNSNCYALAFDNSGNLYAGGAFTTADGNAANRVAKWNGSAWSAIGSGLSSTCYALAFDDQENLYAGTESGFIKWDGSDWAIVTIDTTVITGNIRSFKSGSGKIYIGGSGIGPDTIVNRIVNIKAKMPVCNFGSGLNGQVTAITSFGNNIYAGGRFTTAGGVAAVRIAKWDGSSWSALGSGMNDVCVALAVDSSGNLYAGGGFTTAGGTTVNYVAKWDGSSWSALGSGLDNACLALVFDRDGNLYAGGAFATAGGTTVNRVAKWDGSSWSAIGSGTVGTNGRINGMAFNNSGNLYVVGEFTAAGGNAVNRVAKWDGSNWSAVGDGFTYERFSIAIDQEDNIYVGGYYLSNNNDIDYVAKWNGSSWDPLLTKIGNILLTNYALVIGEDGDLYIGGNRRLERVDWPIKKSLNYDIQDGSFYPSYIEPEINALHNSESGIIAGGTFTTVYGTSTSVASWDGDTIQRICYDSTFNNRYAYALDLIGGAVYAGSYEYFARFVGYDITYLGKGVNNQINAVSAYDGIPYIGGAFTAYL